MAVETVDDLAVFFSVDDFGVNGTYTLNGGAASTIKGIYDNEFLEVDPQSGVGIVSAEPRFVCRSTDIPGAAAPGDALVVSSINYTVRVIQPDGTGVTTLVLERD